MSRDSKGRRRVTSALLVAIAVVAAATGAAAADAEGGSRSDGKRVVYLTFDDGPALDSATGSLLDLLAAEGVTATFFVVGDNASKDPAMIRRIAAEGHAIGNHTQSHRPLNEMSADQIRTQFGETQTAVDRAGGPTMVCYRPPFGASSGLVQSIGASLGMSEELWTLDLHDYERLDPGPYADRLEKVVDGEVVLLHDGFTEGEVTVEAVRRFLRSERDTIEFRALPGCRTGGTTEPPTTPTPTTSTTAMSTSTTATTVPSSTTETTGLSPSGGGAVVVVPSCRFGPLDGTFDTTNPEAGAVFRLYCSHLGRQPDQAGFEYWLSVAVGANSLHPLSYSFLESVEFVATYGDLDHEQFLETVYANVLDRTPDGEGRTYWSGLLEAGLSRSTIMLAFSESAEFRSATGTS